MKKALWAAGFCALVFIAWLTFVRVPNPIYFSQDTEAVRQAILELIPTGSDVGRAKPIMERNGFACTWSRNQQFATFSGHRQTTHPKADFLYCDREHGWLVQERWQVAIVHQNERVVDVQVSYALTGP